MHPNTLDYRCAEVKRTSPPLHPPIPQESKFRPHHAHRAFAAGSATSSMPLSLILTTCASAPYFPKLARPSNELSGTPVAAKLRM